MRFQLVGGGGLSYPYWLYSVILVDSFFGTVWDTMEVVNVSGSTKFPNSNPRKKNRKQLGWVAVQMLHGEANAAKISGVKNIKS